MRLIDADALIKDIYNYYHNSPFPHPSTTWLRGLELAVGLLLKAPTIDAVEVVRCKDCRYWDDDRRCNGIENGLMREYTREDDFCSYGERK